MVKATLSKLIFTKISYDLDIEEKKEFGLEVKNKITLGIPKSGDDNSFLLVIETSVVEPEHNYINILIKSNAFFNCGEKPSSYDDVVNDCFPTVFKQIAEKIDQILDVLNYPKLNISQASSNEATQPQ